MNSIMKTPPGVLPIDDREIICHSNGHACIGYYKDGFYEIDTGNELDIDWWAYVDIPTPTIVDSSKMERTMYESLLDELKVAWDRTLSEKERLQEVRLITLSHGFCTRCQVFHTLDSECE